MTTFSCLHADIAMCLLAAALNPAGSGAGGWSCAGDFPSTNICSTWTGVRCDERGAVKNITLPGLSLHGSIPSALGQVTSLQAIDLSNNAIGGTLPSQLSGLQLIQNINLQGNSIGGTIPNSLSTLTGLTSLNIGGNSVTGTVPSALCSISSYNYGTLACGVSVVDGKY